MCTRVDSILWVHGVLGPGQSTSISIGSAVFAQLSRVPGATENARREIAVYNQKCSWNDEAREENAAQFCRGGGWKMRDTDAGIRKTEASWPRCCSTRNREDVGLSIIRRRREWLR